MFEKNAHRYYALSEDFQSAVYSALFDGWTFFETLVGLFKHPLSLAYPLVPASLRLRKCRKAG